MSIEDTASVSDAVWPLLRLMRGQIAICAAERRVPSARS